MTLKNRVIVREGNLSPEAQRALESSGAYGTGEHILNEHVIETVRFACGGGPEKQHVVAVERVDTAIVAIR